MGRKIEIEIGIENDPEIMSVAIMNVIVNVKGIVTVIGTRTTGTDILIIIGTETGNQSMMRIGKGDGHQGLIVIASPVYHKKKKAVQDPGMLIMGRGGGLLRNS